MPINPKLHLMAGGPVGDVIDLGVRYKRLSITAAAACRVRVQALTDYDAAPTAPVADPVAAAGAEVGWIDMAAGDRLVLPWLEGMTRYRWVEIWELAAGNLVISGEPA